MTTHLLDITKEHCPMTFVKTRLKLEALEAGDVLELLVNAGEPLDNLPKTIAAYGFKVKEIIPVE